MAFTFQINDDVEFNHDKQLLKKADDNIPELAKRVVTPVQVVETVIDKNLLDNVGTKKVADATQLSQMKFGRDDRLILDFGNHYVGHFTIRIKSVGSPMDAPLTLKLKFAELPTELNQDSQDYQGWLSRSWMQEETVHLDELPANLYLPRRYSFRYVEIKVVDTSPKWQVSFFEPALIAESAAQGAPTPFHTDDKLLQKIDQVGLKTLADCMQDVFEDGPKRDRRLWIGDLRLQALADYQTYDNQTLIKRCLYLFGALAARDGRIPANVFVKPTYTPDDTFLLDYSLFFVSILDDYFQHTDDYTVLEDLYPVAKKQIDYVMKNMVQSNGKIVFDEDYPVFVDWSNEFNKDTAGVAIVIYALKQFIHLSRLQRLDTIDYYQKELAQITNYAKQNLYNEERGLFISGPDHEINIASQVWMVLAQVMTPEENHQLMSNAVKKLFPIKGIATPYMYHHVTQALFEAGLTDAGIQLLKDYWGKMIELGADTFWEAFDPNDPSYSPYGSAMVNSYCHAWSCTPVYLMRKYLS
ncbi:alpha-rhamnosidase [Pediococcus acidilactici]|uniref:alpha-L-rhamnosidase-related protein n=1 Tax=Pediococcus acidilactici TaxID=1254 RepID=UPI00191262DE|nr:alpha-rhamnosidase [Pediococcus acidilactici]QQP83963.1 alpha-rhamnosidase [Pediococcus acidilactici]